ncbi:MAG: zf-HC2 domain-containing protein, partial [Clostridia bacterium]|nr:zf-HC2 domain-containing protein [Clostridia bacterium]
MEENKISCTEAAALMEKYLDGELDTQGEAALKSHIASCEACFSEFEKLKKTTELLKESALEPPAELYGAVMKKINAEKKKKNLFIRRAGTVCAAALIFVVASVYMMPKFLGGDNVYSPDGISLHNVKSSESDMSVYDGTDGGGMIACSLLSELEIRNGAYFKIGEYKNGTPLKLAKVQMGTL